MRRRRKRQYRRAPEPAAPRVRERFTTLQCWIVVDFLGHPLTEATDEEVVSTMLLQAAPLLQHRERFPAMLDADAFTLG